MFLIDFGGSRTAGGKKNGKFSGTLAEGVGSIQFKDFQYLLLVERVGMHCATSDQIIPNKILEFEVDDVSELQILLHPHILALLEGYHPGELGAAVCDALLERQQLRGSEVLPWELSYVNLLKLFSRQRLADRQSCYKF